MSLESKITEAVIGKEGEVKREALLKALEDFAVSNAEENRKQEFYKLRELARIDNEKIISDFSENKRQEFNVKWQSFEDNDFTIVK